MNKRYVSSVLVVIFCILFAIQPFALPSRHARGPLTVRVGYIDYKGFIEPDDKGQFRGYAVEYLNEVSKYTNWRYEYVYNDWSTLLKMLENKEIDLICSAQKTPEREEKYEFSKFPIGNTECIIYSAADDDRFYYNDYEAYDGAKVAMLKDNAVNNFFFEKVKEANVEVTPVYCSSDSETIAKIDNGEADLAISELLSFHADHKIVGSFGMDPYYFISYKGSRYMSDLNLALEEIKKDPYFEATLYSRYYGTSAIASQPLFTRVEKEFVKNNPKLTVALPTDEMPLAYYDNAKKQFDGIAVIMLERIGEVSGQSVEFLPKDRSAEADFELCTVYYETDAPSLSDRYSKPIFKDGVSMLCLGGKKPSLGSGNTLKIAFTSNSTDEISSLRLGGAVIDPITVESFTKSTEALDKRKADCILKGRFIASDFIQRRFDNKYTAVPLENVSVMYCLRSNRNTVGISAINKVVDTFDPNEQLDRASTFVTEHTYKLTLKDYYKIYEPWIKLGIAAFLIIILLTVMIFVSKHRSLKEIARQNESIAKANEEILQANNVKSEFLTRMSHDIRTPMSAVLTSCTLAEQEIEDKDAVRGYIANIKTAGEYLLGLVNDILDMSALERSKLKLTRKYCVPEELTSPIVNLWGTLCKTKGIELSVTHSLDGYELEIDKRRFEQICYNIISNSVKFTPEGGKITVALDKGEETEDKVKLVLTVSDTGKGISEEFAKRMFEPFEREESAGHIEGSGLGLSIVRDLVRLNGGTVSASSKQGEGTVITVVLPLKYKKVKSQKSWEDADDIRLDGISVLLVEDHPINIALTEKILVRAGAKVKTARNGLLALEIFKNAKEHTFDVVLSDMRMPELDGVELAERIKESGRADGGIPVIILTAETAQREFSREIHIFSVLRKPVEPTAICAEILRAVSDDKKDN